MRKGTTKVMVNRKGVPRIQEEIGDTVKVYSLPEWNAEMDKRIKEDTESKKETKKEKVKAKEPKKKTNSNDTNVFDGDEKKVELPDKEDEKVIGKSKPKKINKA
jgi:hypothetical protein